MAKSDVSCVETRVGGNPRSLDRSMHLHRNIFRREIPSRQYSRVLKSTNQVHTYAYICICTYPTPYMPANKRFSDEHMRVCVHLDSSLSRCRLTCLHTPAQMVRHRAFASAWVMLLITVLSPVAVSGYLGAAVLAKSRVAPPRPLRGGGASTLAAQLPVVNRQGRPMRCIVTGGSSGIGEAICGEVCVLIYTSTHTDDPSLLCHPRHACSP